VHKSFLWRFIFKFISKWAYRYLSFQLLLYITADVRGKACRWVAWCSNLSKVESSERVDFIKPSKLACAMHSMAIEYDYIIQSFSFPSSSCSSSSNVSPHLSNSRRNRNSPLNRARPSRPPASLRQLLLTRDGNVLAPKLNSLRYSNS
jgi:hypothetical protein